MQSPATHPVRYIHQAYADSVQLPLRIFLSSGDRNDNEARTRAFRDVLQAKGYPMKYIEVPFAHNWQNWGRLLRPLLFVRTASIATWAGFPRASSTTTATKFSRWPEIA